MKKIIAALVLLLAAYTASCQTVTLTSTNLTSGGAPVTGTLVYTPTDTRGFPISYRIGGGGTAISTPTLVPVVAGVSSVVLPDTTQTYPANICFALTLQYSHSFTKNYSCLQPHTIAANAQDWCQAGVCSLDNYLGNPSPLLTTFNVENINGVAGQIVFQGNITRNGSTFTVGGGSGGGSVNDFLAPPTEWPSWLVPSVANPTTAPSLTVAAGVVPALNGGTGEAGAFSGIRKANGTTADTQAGASDIGGTFSENCSSDSPYLEYTGICGPGGSGGGGAVTAIIPGNGISCATNIAGQCIGAVTISTGPTFGITSFTCSTCGTYEYGQTVASPTNFTAAYSIAPVSASISDGTNSTTLTTPFTSGSLAYSYTPTTSVPSFTFTLTAVGITTQTASQNISGAPRFYSGVGAAGATSAVTTAGTTAVLSTGDVLASAGVSTGSDGTYTLFPNNQKIYLLLVGCGHTFTSAGFNFPMNAPTNVMLTNQYGQSISECLYEAVNLLTNTISGVPVTVAN